MPTQEFLNKVKDSDEKMRLEKQRYLDQAPNAKESALKKMGEITDSFHSREPLGFTNLNKRQFGPYELQTLLGSDSSQDDKTKSAKLINSVRFMGGKHSLKDAQTIARELKPLEGPVDPSLANHIMNLGQSIDNNSGDVYVEGLNRISENLPLWGTEKEIEQEKEKTRQERFKKTKDALGKSINPTGF